MSKHYNFHNSASHFGDCLWSIHFLNKLCDRNNITASFFCQEKQRVEARPLIQNSNLSMSETKADNAIDVWWCDPFNRIKNEDYLPYFACSFNHGYQNLHGMIYAGLDKLCKELNFEPAFDSPYDLIFDEDIFKQPFNFSFDFLVVNSDFFSNQLILTETQKDLVFEDLIEQIVNNGKTFITTKKIANYPCTLDTNLSLVNIGQLAKNCKTIIAIATAPFVSVLNKYSLESCEHFINFTHDWNSLGDFEKLINIESVENLFSLVENL